nr:hypothetical protein [Candidatus Sigynarchaeota archaeon]
MFGLTNTTFSKPGWEIYKVQVQLIDNQTTSVNDWVNLHTIDEGSFLRIEPNITQNYLTEGLAQAISQNWRVQIKNITTRLWVDTGFPALVPAPKMQLWDDTGGSGPNLPRYSIDMTKSSGGVVWYGIGTNFIINASAAVNHTWYVVINGTQWGDSVSSNSADYINWYAGTGPVGQAYSEFWPPTTGWWDEPRTLCLAYQRLFLNDSNGANRTFKASEINLRINGTAFNNTGYATITGSNIRALNFSSDTSCVNFRASYKIYYRRNVAAYRTFFTNGGPSISWNITSKTPVDYPIGLKSDVKLNMTRPATWTVSNVYNASSIAGLSGASPYVSVTQVGNEVVISNIKSNSTWQVRCTSSNQITDIVEQVNGKTIITANVSNNIQFYALLGTSQSTGNLSVGVYYQANNSRAFLTSNASLGVAGTTNVTLPSIWATLGKPFGTYRVQSRWNSSIDVGFRDETLLVDDPLPPVTAVVYSGNNTAITNGDRIRIDTSFTLNATDTGTGVNFANLTIVGPAPATTKWTGRYVAGTNLTKVSTFSWTVTFTFEGLGILVAGIYDVSWYSVDISGKIEVRQTCSLNLTRLTTVSISSISQPEYSYVDTTPGFAIYYGKNATTRLSFFDDKSLPISSADLINISIGGQSFIGTSVIAGIYDVVMRVSSLDAGSYPMIITAVKSGLNINRQSIPLTILPVSVNMTLVSITQDGVPLDYNSGADLYTGRSGKILLINIAVNNSMSQEPMTQGQMLLIYKYGTTIQFNATVSDIDNDGVFVIILPDTVELTTVAIITYQWIAPSANYVNTTVGDPYEFNIQFRALIQDIKWDQVVILLIFLAIIPIIYTAVLKKVVIPKRQARHNFLAKISSAFEDAANIQNVLIIHKASGTCLFFKSYGKTTVDPDLITGFLTAIQSFGAEMSGNKAMEELTWQDYQLVLGEGALIRIALVLASKASGILKGLVPQFVAKYEALYRDKLQNWRGDLTSFRDSLKVIDDIFDTSIILPHKRSDMPISPRSSLSKKILDVAGALTRERDYFFIATLLSESIEKTKQSYAEIIAAIQELREDDILVPIDIESLEKKKEMTQQEVVALQQRVAQISFLSPEEKAKLLQDLMKMSANEREASLSSMMIMTQLQNATTQSIRSGGAAQPAKSAATVSSKVSVDMSNIKTKKDASNQIKSLDKNAKISLKNYQYQDAIKAYEQAEIIAAQWNMKDEVTEITHKKIEASTREIQYRQAVVISEAQTAEQAGDVPLAVRKYTEAANYSSALFKLGVSTEDKKMREFQKKAELLKKGAAKT